jgi:hypothetical protein
MDRFGHYELIGGVGVVGDLRLLVSVQCRVRVLFLTDLMNHYLMMARRHRHDSNFQQPSVKVVEVVEYVVAVSAVVVVAAVMKMTEEEDELQPEENNTYTADHGRDREDPVDPEAQQSLIQHRKSAG